MQALKTFKRRTWQFFVSSKEDEEIMKDPEYEALCKLIYGLETQFVSILQKVKESKRVTERYSQAQSNLAIYLALPFTRPEGEAKSLPPHSSQQLSRSMQYLNSPVTTSCCAFVQKNCIEPLQKLTQNDFPEFRRRINNHNGVKLDIASYQRRVNNLRKKGVVENDPKMVKFSTKLTNAINAYNTEHQVLMEKMRIFYNSRFDILEPVYVSIVASQIELHGYFTKQMETISKSTSNPHLLPIIEDEQNVIRRMIATETKVPTKQRVIQSEPQEPASSGPSHDAENLKIDTKADNQLEGLRNDAMADNEPSDIEYTKQNHDYERKIEKGTVEVVGVIIDSTTDLLVASAPPKDDHEDNNSVNSSKELHDSDYINDASENFEASEPEKSPRPSSDFVADTPVQRKKSIPMSAEVFIEKGDELMKPNYTVAS